MSACYWRERGVYRAHRTTPRMAERPSPSEGEKFLKRRPPVHPSVVDALKLLFYHRSLVFGRYYRRREKTRKGHCTHGMSFQMGSRPWPARAQGSTVSMPAMGNSHRRHMASAMCTGSQAWEAKCQQAACPCHVKMQANHTWKAMPVHWRGRG